MTRLLVFVALLAAAFATRAGEPETTRVLIVGNSLTYTNNLPAALAALGDAQPQPVRIEADMYVHPGASLAELAAEPAVFDAIRTGAYDAVVLQERGGDVMCVDSVEERSSKGCTSLMAAHRELASAARDSGSSVVYLGTWQTLPQVSRTLDASERLVSEAIGARHVRTSEHWHKLRAALPDAPWLDPDGGHPGNAMTVLMTVDLFRSLFDREPVAAEICFDAPLYTPNGGPRGLVRDARGAASARHCLMDAAGVARIVELGAGR